MSYLKLNRLVVKQNVQGFHDWNVGHRFICFNYAPLVPKAFHFGYCAKHYGTGLLMEKGNNYLSAYM